MITDTSEKYTSHNSWFHNVICENVILCRTSALEFLGFFTGFVNEGVIDVYALEKGAYSNINYHIVENFKNIAFITSNGVCCTSFEQTVNDMLNNLEDTDEWALTEALSNYYYSNMQSFEGLSIKPENITSFESIKQNAIDYYNS